MRNNSIECLGVRIDPLTLQDLLDRVEALITSPGKYRVMYVNVHCLNLAQEDEDYRRILNTADLLYCDGWGVVLGARLQGSCLPQRLTSADFVYPLSLMCQQKGYSLYLLGSEPGVAEEAGQRLMSLYPGIKIIGTCHGYTSNSQREALLKEINSLKPDLLLVGMGSPLQERWIDENFPKLEARVIWGVGALFDFISGRVRRCPDWMGQRGLEWFYRFMVEPRRMWRRYLVGNPLFVARCVRERIFQKEEKKVI